MYRGTTPVYQIRFTDGTGQDIVEIVLTFKQAYGAKVVLKLSDHQIALNGDIATASLTQEQTLRFRAGTVQRQVKYKTSDDKVGSIPIATEAVTDDLHGAQI